MSTTYIKNCALVPRNQNLKILFSTCLIFKLMLCFNYHAIQSIFETMEEISHG